MGLPIILHCRDSFNEVYNIINKHQDGRLTGVFHCFTGSVDDAKKIIDVGFMMGIGGVATFKNGGLDKSLINISLEHLVLETDAPYLTPTPFRGKRNEPSYIEYVVKKLSDIYQESKDEIAHLTTNNAKCLFKLT
jgi:TatD DNase family protein